MTSKSTTSNCTITRYLVVVPMMDAADPEPGVEPTAYTGIIDAASRAEAQSLAEEFALDLAMDRSAWTEDADDLPLADAQEVLRANGFYLGEPLIEPLAKVAHITGAARD